MTFLPLAYKCPPCIVCVCVCVRTVTTQCVQSTQALVLSGQHMALANRGSGLRGRVRGRGQEGTVPLQYMLQGGI